MGETINDLQGLRAAGTRGYPKRHAAKGIHPSMAKARHSLSLSADTEGGGLRDLCQLLLLHLLLLHDRGYEHVGGDDRLTCCNAGQPHTLIKQSCTGLDLQYLCHIPSPAPPPQNTSKDHPPRPLHASSTYAAAPPCYAQLQGERVGSSVGGGRKKRRCPISETDGQQLPHWADLVRIDLRFSRIWTSRPASPRSRACGSITAPWRHRCSTGVFLLPKTQTGKKVSVSERERETERDGGKSPLALGRDHCLPPPLVSCDGDSWSTRVSK